MKRCCCLARVGLYLGVTLIVAGCGTVHTVRSTNPHEAVRRVDFRRAPELKELAEHARQFGVEMYPRVWELFADEGQPPPERFDIVFRPMDGGKLGETFVELRRISLNASYLTNTTEGRDILDKVLVHEMAHMALRHDTFRWSRPQAEWEEGLADYAYFKLVSTNGWGCPQCDYRFPHYTSGYTCAGAFLLYVDSQYGADVVRQFSTAIRERRDPAAGLAMATGKNLAELWADFQKTSAFKPGAVGALALQQALGFDGIKPPRNVLRRFNRYLDQHADDFTRQAVKSANVDGKPMNNIRTLIAVYLYFNQPGGAAERAWLELREKGNVPGIIKGEKGSLSVTLRAEEITSQDYPQTRTLTARKLGDAAYYHYTMTRDSTESGWRLTKAWRADAEGKVLEDFSVP